MGEAGYNIEQLFNEWLEDFSSRLKQTLEETYEIDRAPGPQPPSPSPEDFNTADSVYQGWINRINQAASKVETTAKQTVRRVSSASRARAEKPVLPEDVAMEVIDAIHLTLTAYRSYIWFFFETGEIDYRVFGELADAAVKLISLYRYLMIPKVTESGAS